MAAECPLCATRHPGGLEVCPDRRTDETVCGKYAVGELLGVGGMAAVYQARHTVLSRDVALKIVHRRYARDAELAARFVREARETGAIGHPAFVGVHDAGTTEDGCAFIEMDRLDGRDLYTLRTAEGTLAIPRAVAIAVALCDALIALHARGVIHRDLKSANVFVVVGPDGAEHVKLLDLGFAKVVDEQKLTSPTSVLGTPFYISPEQYEDPTSVDARADLFSLGVIVFEMLTGEWPYTYTSKHDLFKKVLRGEMERNPRRLREDVPAWLDSVVARALAHKREARFESATAMRRALGAGESPPREPPRKSGLFRRLLGR